MPGVPVDLSIARPEGAGQRFNIVGKSLDVLSAPAPFTIKFDNDERLTITSAREGIKRHDCERIGVIEIENEAASGVAQLFYSTIFHPGTAGKVSALGDTVLAQLQTLPGAPNPFFMTGVSEANGVAAGGMPVSPGGVGGGRALAWTEGILTVRQWADTNAFTNAMGHRYTRLAPPIFAHYGPNGVDEIGSFRDAGYVLEHHHYIDVFVAGTSGGSETRTEPFAVIGVACKLTYNGTQNTTSQGFTIGPALVLVARPSYPNWRVEWHTGANAINTLSLVAFEDTGVPVVPLAFQRARWEFRPGIILLYLDGALAWTHVGRWAHDVGLASMTINESPAFGFGAFKAGNPNATGTIGLRVTEATYGLL